jgi:hypothetical protein
MLTAIREMDILPPPLSFLQKSNSAWLTQVADRLIPNLVSAYIEIC